MTVKEMQLKVDDWIKTVGVRYFDQLTNTTILMEEVGELARLMARHYGEQSFKEPVTEEFVKKKIGEELADILFVVACLANQTETDLTTAFNNKLRLKTYRDANRHKDNPKLQ